MNHDDYASALATAALTNRVSADARTIRQEEGKALARLVEILDHRRERKRQSIKEFWPELLPDPNIPNDLLLPPSLFQGVYDIGPNKVTLAAINPSQTHNPYGEDEPTSGSPMRLSSPSEYLSKSSRVQELEAYVPSKPRSDISPAADRPVNFQLNKRNDGDNNNDHPFTADAKLSSMMRRLLSLKQSENSPEIVESVFKDIFKEAVQMHTGSQGFARDVERAKRFYNLAKLHHDGAANNVAVILQKEGGPNAEENLREAFYLYQYLSSHTVSEKAKANLALLLWRGTKHTPKDVPRAISLLQKAVDDGQLPRHKVLLARVLLSDEAGPHRDAVRARSLLEEAVKEAMFSPALQDLAALLSRGDVGVQRDAERANRLHALFQRRTAAGGTDTDAIDDIEDPQLVLWEELPDIVEERLRAAKARQSQCFLLTLGGAARGKTSVVRSLRGMPFVADHNPTELASVTRFQVLPGDRHLSDEELEELAFSRDSLTANLSRMPDSGISAASTEDDPIASTGHKPVADPSISSEDVVPKTTSVGRSQEESQKEDETTAANVGRRQGGSQEEDITSEPGKTRLEGTKRGFSSVLSRVSNGFSEKAIPAGTNGALVQCWDLAGQSQYMMAHALFVRNGNVFVFVINVKRLMDEEQRLEEVRELCRWMQLVYALVEKPTCVRPIIVGTHKDSCEYVEEEVTRVLHEGLRKELGTAIYDTWVRVDVDRKTGGDCSIQFVAVENSAALNDPKGSGLDELERIVKCAADGIVEARQEVPARWLAFVEELEKDKALFLNKADVSRWVDGFPAFDRDKEVRDMDALQALRYFSRLGRLVLFEVSEDELYVFPRPAVVLDFVRRVTGPEELAQKRLGQKHVNMLDRGLLTHEGLEALWHGYSDEIRDVMFELLCRFDLLMRLPPAQDDDGDCDEVIGIPALLPKTGKGLQWNRRAGELEVRVVTKFTDSFPPGLIGSMISYLHKKIGGGRTRAGFLRSDAAILTSRVELKQKGRVRVAFMSAVRRIEWRVLAEDPVGVVQGCLRALEDFLTCPFRGIQMSRTHMLMTKCRSDAQGCGGEWTVEFPLPTEWVRDTVCESLPNLEGECASSCEELWTLWDLLPNMRVFARRIGSTNIASVLKPFDVFISHAGDDKVSIARPLYKELSTKGLHCFLDKIGLEPGDSGPDKMTEAMETAPIGVFILSPEFAARRWTVRELRCFLKRRREASSSSGVSPILIPVFYRLTIQECRYLDPEKYSLADGSSLFSKEGFYDEDRQQEAPTEVVKEVMKEVTGITGIENDEGASNDMADPFSFQTRDHLVKRIAMWVIQKRDCHRQRMTCRRVSTNTS